MDLQNASEERRAFVPTGEKEEDIKLSSAPVPYYTLYKKIAAVNAALIKERDDMKKERKAFFKSHPEIH